MAGLHDEHDEKPLDPAVERVRRKLLRFIIINLSLLFAAVIIVIAAIVYRAATKDVPPVATADSAVASRETVEAQIPLPAGARILSQSLAGNRVALDLELTGGGRMILVYDYAERRVVARLTTVAE